MEAIEINGLLVALSAIATVSPLYTEKLTRRNKFGANINGVSDCNFFVIKLTNGEEILLISSKRNKYNFVYDFDVEELHKHNQEIKELHANLTNKFTIQPYMQIDIG